MASGAPLSGRTLFVAGTRPEAVKLAPVIIALKARRANPYLLATGQHRELFTDVLTAFGLAADDNLGLMTADQGPADVVGSLVPRLTRILAELGPDAVVVQGDTATTFAAAQAAFYARLPLVHVEAGLRSGGSDPFPEEAHRRAIGQLADLHLAPTPAARTALLSEGIAPASIHVTGNTGIDALHWMEARLANDPALNDALARRFAWIDMQRPLILATIHRRENHGAPLKAVLAALAVVSRDAEIVLPVHPHPAVAGPVSAALAGCAGVHLMPSLDYPAFVWLLKRATLALTDSGGVQEEAPALGVPLLVLRDVTERREGIASGNARLIGTATAAIVAAIRGLLADSRAIGRMAEPALPYGAGDAGSRIADILLARFGVPAIAIAAE